MAPRKKVIEVDDPSHGDNDLPIEPAGTSSQRKETRANHFPGSPSCEAEAYSDATDNGPHLSSSVHIPKTPGNLITPATSKPTVSEMKAERTPMRETLASTAFQCGSLLTEATEDDINAIVSFAAGEIVGDSPLGPRTAEFQSKTGGSQATRFLAIINGDAEGVDSPDVGLASIENPKVTCAPFAHTTKLNAADTSESSSSLQADLRVHRHVHTDHADEDEEKAADHLVQASSIELNTEGVAHETASRSVRHSLKRSASLAEYDYDDYLHRTEDEETPYCQDDDVNSEDEDEDESGKVVKCSKVAISNGGTSDDEMDNETNDNARVASKGAAPTTSESARNPRRSPKVGIPQCSSGAPTPLRRKIVVSGHSMVSRNADYIAWLNQHQIDVVDHVTSVDICVIPAGRLHTTATLLRSLLNNIEIVTDKWVEESVQIGRILDTTPFIHPKFMDNDHINRSKIFMGQTLIFTPKLCTDYGTGWKDIKMLAAGAGAEEVLRGSTRVFKNMGDDVLVLGSVEADKEAEKLMADGVVVFSKDMLTHAILCGKANIESDEFHLEPSRLDSPPPKRKGKKLRTKMK